MSRCQDAVCNCAVESEFSLIDHVHVSSKYFLQSFEVTTVCY